MALLQRVLLLSAAALTVLVATGSGQGRPGSGPPVEVVVTLGPPAGRTALVDAAQRSFEGRLAAAVPSARVRWRYRLVLDGLAVVVPAAEIDRVAALPGVTRVYRSVRYHERLDRSPSVIGAPELWGPGLATAGQGMKIGIIDDGLDQTHPFFDPAGFAMPPGFPKGNTAFTTAKVIVARAFPPATPAYANAARPFDPGNSFHATHVAGIAAGNNGLTAVVPREGTFRNVSGVAPKAYLGNYKALTIPTPGFGLDGNSPEIAAAIEAAVADGMDVINLSLGEPEVEPERDLVVLAINGAADRGVIPVVAAGNDFDQFGYGSVSSPGNAAKAITVAAVSKLDVIAPFSSAGPTPVSLQAKPDLSAPGVSIVSSLPDKSWGILQGTSMASPHVAGGAALLRERHPTWTVAQVKSALALTAVPVYTDLTRTAETPTTREGAGLINLPRADTPLLFADPVGLSFGEPRQHEHITRTVSLSDAGGGAGDWAVSIQQQTSSPLVTVTAPPTVTVPGTLAVDVQTGNGEDRDFTGFVVIARGTVTRRIPYWFHVTAPRLGSEPHATLRGPGVYTGTTKGRPALVSTYRYPEDPTGAGLPASYPGPELVYRVTLDRPVANFGVAVIRHGAHVRIDPHVVFAGDENHLVGYPGLPLNLNPYLPVYGRTEPVAGAILPKVGSYDVVFDTVSAAEAGAFSFRYWIDDVTPPALRLVRARPLTIAVTDAGAGVDPRSIVVRVDGSARPARYAAGKITVPGKLAPGRHRVVVQTSDFQETKNMEDVPLILPNTRVLRTVVRVP